MTGKSLHRSAVRLSLVVLLACGACASTSKHVPASTAEGSTISPAVLASRVRDAIREAGYLRFEGWAEGVVWPWRNGDPDRYGVRFVQRMDRDRLRMDVSSLEGTPVLTVLYADGVVTEYWPRCETPTGEGIEKIRAQINRGKIDQYLLEQVCTKGNDCGLLATYSAPWDDGVRVPGTNDPTTGLSSVSSRQLCLVGNRFASWISPQFNVPDTFHRWVRNGRILTPEQSISGRRCIPVMWSKTNMGFLEDQAHGWDAVPPSQVNHILYFDAESYQLVRWDSVIFVLQSPLYVNARSGVLEEIVVEDQAPEGAWEPALPSFAKRETVFVYPK